MKAKIIIILVLGVCVWGAVRHFYTPSDAIARLIAAPGRIPSGSRGGMANIPPAYDLERQCEDGRTTVFVVTQSTCSNCRTLESHLAQFLVLRPDVAIRFLRLGDQWKQDQLEGMGINVRSVPHVLIYDGEGDLVAADDGLDKDGLNTLWRWMSTEIRKRSVRSGGG